MLVPEKVEDRGAGKNNNLRLKECGVYKRRGQGVVYCSLVSVAGDVAWRCVTDEWLTGMLR